MPTIPFENELPVIGKSAWIAPNAWVIGKVQLGEETSVFFGAVLRGDIQRIVIGNRTNIQDNAVLHTSRGLKDLTLGENVTVGHGAILHGCQIENHCIIGMGSTVLDNAHIGENCILGANSLVTMRTEIPAGSMAFGNPAKVVRQLNERELKELRDSAESYVRKARFYRELFATL
jgi:carbonic anhydrase/acetyltransferase-like protein (isoleucine patch superfamily)